MDGEKILTLHPTSKSGRNISRHIYDICREAILDTLRDQELTHNELFAYLNTRLHGKFAGNISWYGETVKLDLEARGIIVRSDDVPQKYRRSRHG